jgi:hypothetical protein
MTHNAAPNEIRDGKREKENCISGNMEQGNLGKVGPGFEQPPPLADRQRRDTEILD